MYTDLEIAVLAIVFVGFVLPMIIAAWLSLIGVVWWVIQVYRSEY